MVTRYSKVCYSPKGISQPSRFPGKTLMQGENSNLRLIHMVLMLKLADQAVRKNNLEDNLFSEYSDYCSCPSCCSHNIKENLLPNVLDKQLEQKFEEDFCEEVLQILDKQKNEIEECRNLIITRIRHLNNEIEELRDLISYYSCPD